MHDKGGERTPNQARERTGSSAGEFRCFLLIRKLHLHPERAAHRSRSLHLNVRQMELMERSECLRWCERQGIPLSRDGKPELPSDREIEEFSIPADAGERVSLVREHVGLFEGDAEVLVWITDWSVWPSGERIHMFDRFRLSYGFESDLTERPGHLLKENEFDELASLVTFAALFLWDCYVISADGRKSLFYSHDEFGTLTRNGVEQARDATE